MGDHGEYPDKDKHSETKGVYEVNYQTKPINPWSDEKPEGVYDVNYHTEPINTREYFKLLFYCVLGLLMVGVVIGIIFNYLA